CMRIPFKYYMPESMLTKEMKKADQEQEQTAE
ncbi:MAG: DNA-binding protein, partial [Bacteroides ovatus]|nr:DNA-binding protein [Bacteroides ovatus]